MADFLERLKKVESAKSKADAQLQVAEERLMELRGQLKNLGIESSVDVEALKLKIAEEIGKVNSQLDDAEKLLSEIS